MRRLPLLLLTLVSLLAVSAPVARAEGPPAGAEWSEEYFPSVDGTTLHADVLRPKGLPKDAKTPVLLTVSPYVNHASQTGTDYDPEAKGPSHRFYDFIEPAKIFERGYTYVIVDLRGSGGSGSCNDWGGPGERGDVKAAVEWAASQPWSTGKVGHIGKSYDGWTGLMAIAERPKGLAAVVSMEPVFSGYKYLYMNGVRFINSVATPGSFTVIDHAPGSTNDSPQYFLNSPPNPACRGLNAGQQQQNSETVAFWEERNLLPPLKGATTPLLLQQGYLETNTKPDGAFDVERDYVGPFRGWYGQWDHVRGYEKAGEDFAVGRGGFLEESIAWFDHYVRGDGPAPLDATLVQDQKGRFRNEQKWPPADATVLRSKLNDGSYTDDGANDGSGAGGGQGIWSVSQPLPYAAHLAGEPIVRAAVSGATPASNFVANVYDVAPDGTSTLVSRGATLTATNELELRLYGQDWVFEPGHRVGVLISSANAEWWVHAPSQQPITVAGASIELPFLKFNRAAFVDGGVTGRLEGHLSSAKIETPQGGEIAFNLPPALAPMPVDAPGVAVPLKPTKDKLTIKVKRSGKGLLVTGRSPKNALVTVTALKGKKTLQTVNKKTRTGKFTVRLKKAGKATSVVVRAAGLRAVKKVPKAKGKKRR